MLSLLKKFFLKIKFKKLNTKIYSKYVSKDVKIGINCIVGKNTHISENVKIGNFTYFNSNVLDIIVESNVKIGNYCSIGPGVLIGLGNHYINTITTHPILFNKYYKNCYKGYQLNQKLNGLVDDNLVTVIGSDVWIGARANIKRGVHIGNGAIIAAESVVTKDVPDFSIVAGVPAKVIKYRFSDEDINFLKKYENYCFWNWQDDFLIKNFDKLYDIEDYINLLKKQINNVNDFI